MKSGQGRGEEADVIGGVILSRFASKAVGEGCSWAGRCGLGFRRRDSHKGVRNGGVSLQ